MGFSQCLGGLLPTIGGSTAEFFGLFRRASMLLVLLMHWKRKQKKVSTNS